MEPRRIEKNGIAITSITSAAAVANSAGRACRTPVQRAQQPAPSRACQLAVGERAAAFAPEHAGAEEAEQRR